MANSLAVIVVELREGETPWDRVNAPLYILPEEMQKTILSTVKGEERLETLEEVEAFYGNK